MKYLKAENWENNEGDPRFIKLIVHGILWIVVTMIFIFSFPFGTVGAGERGVKLRFGAVEGKELDEGLYFRIPLVEKIKKIDVKVQKTEAVANAASKDLQTVNSQVAINYHLDPSKVTKIYQEVGINYAERLITPAVQESVKASTANFTAEELITKRQTVKEEIKQLLKDRLVPVGIMIDEFNITNFDFSQSFNQAIEAKVTAEQQALAAKNKLEQIKFEAQQNIEFALGKAEAIKIESQALRDNPQVLELRAIEKWSGNLPNVVGSDTVPFVNIPM